MSSKDGFSVVAPTRTMVPSSISGRKASCCARLKRWISSTKSSVPRPLVAAQAGGLEDLLQVGDAGEDRADLDEGEVGGVGEQAGDRGLADAGRAPEDDRAELAVGEHPAERAVGAEQVVLADDLRRAAAGAAGRRGAAAPRPPRGRTCRGVHRRDRPWADLTAGRGPAHARSRDACATPVRLLRSGSIAGAAYSAEAASSAATRALSPAPLAAGSRSTSSTIAIGAMSP